MLCGLCLLSEACWVPGGDGSIVSLVRLLSPFRRPHPYLGLISPPHAERAIGCSKHWVWSSFFSCLDKEEKVNIFWREWVFIVCEHCTFNSSYLF